MSGALVDLVAIGIQDTFITGNPQVSFFRSNYNRYVNFSLQPAKLDVIGQGAAGGGVKIVIPNKGDLLGSIWVDVTSLAADSSPLSLSVTKLEINAGATGGTVTHTIGDRAVLTAETFTVTGWDTGATTLNQVYLVTGVPTTTTFTFTATGMAAVAPLLEVGLALPQPVYANPRIISTITNSTVAVGTATTNECTITYTTPLTPALQIGEVIKIAGHTGSTFDTNMNQTFAVTATPTATTATLEYDPALGNLLLPPISITITAMNKNFSIDISSVTADAGSGTTLLGTATYGAAAPARAVRVGEIFTVSSPVTGTWTAAFDGAYTVTGIVDPTNFTFSKDGTGMPVGVTAAPVASFTCAATVTSAGIVTTYAATDLTPPNRLLVEAGEILDMGAVGLCTVSGSPTAITGSTFSFTSATLTAVGVVATTGVNDGDYTTGTIVANAGHGAPVGVYNATSNINVTQGDTPTEFSLYIGNKMIDRQDGFFINTIWPLCLASTPTKALQPTTFFPLHFFNCDNNETPIPLVALQNQTTEIHVKYSPHSTPGNLNYYAEFIHLDTAERKWFTSNDHDLLITQVQKVPADANGSDLCYLNHPVKGLMWGTVPPSTFGITGADILLNSSSIFDTSLPSKFFTNVQRYYHCDNTIDHATANEIYMYSFAERLNTSQPSGTCNFSRLNNASIKWDATGNPNTPTSVYAVNYNILSIKNGLAGIKFSN